MISLEGQPQVQLRASPVRISHIRRTKHWCTERCLGPGLLCATCQQQTERHIRIQKIIRAYRFCEYQCLWCCGKWWSYVVHLRCLALAATAYRELASITTSLRLTNKTALWYLNSCLAKRATNVWWHRMDSHRLGFKTLMCGQTSLARKTNL